MSDVIIFSLEFFEFALWVSMIVSAISMKHEEKRSPKYFELILIKRRTCGW